MANFVRDGIALQIPETALSLIKTCFDNDDAKIESLELKLDSLNKSLGTITLDGIEYKAEKPLINLVKEQQNVKAQLDSLTAKNEALTAELEKLRLDSSEDTIAKRIAARRELERRVFPVLDAEESELAKASDRRLKEMVVAARYPEKFSLDSLASKSDEAVDGMFEIAIANSNPKTSADRQRETLDSLNMQTDSLTEAYKAYVNDTDTAYLTLLKQGR